jgi:hypothetical protein
MKIKVVDKHVRVQGPEVVAAFEAVCAPRFWPVHE